MCHLLYLFWTTRWPTGTPLSADGHSATRALPSAAEGEDASIDALRALRNGGWRIRVVSNGVTAHQARKLEITGVADVVDAVCISEEVGARKPDRRIFEEAAR